MRKEIKQASEGIQAIRGKRSEMAMIPFLIMAWLTKNYNHFRLPGNGTSMSMATKGDSSGAQPQSNMIKAGRRGKVG